MTEFSDKLRAFKKKTYERTNQVMNGIATEAYRSIVMGSEITGAPGQPVDTGRLRASWQLIWEGPKGPIDIVTNVVYARQIEDGVSHWGKPLVLRSQVGGFHSVKLTVSSMPMIVKKVVEEVTGA